jgi:polyphosphate kinase
MRFALISASEKISSVYSHMNSHPSLRRTRRRAVYPQPRITNVPPVQEASRVAFRSLNRDLSLVEFFRRVLEEGLDTRLPLLERLKFLSIFSSNLDEFFMIRVPGLKLHLDDPSVSHDGMTTREVLAAIRRRIAGMVRQQSECLRYQILPALAENDIHIRRYCDLGIMQQANVRDQFERRIYPVLTPQAVDPSHPFPYVSGGSLNLGLWVKPMFHQRVAHALNNNFGEDIFVRIKIPSCVPRFIEVVPGSDTFVLAEDVITSNIRSVVPEADPADCHVFRITRDADLELIEAEARDLLEMMEENLRLRRFGDVVRLEVSTSIPPSRIGQLSECLEVNSEDVYTIDGPLDISDFDFLTKLDRPNLKDRPLETSRPPALDVGDSTFDAIKRGDILLHHPYMPYSIVTDFIAEAADDPQVVAIKMCLYRMGAESPIPPLLIKASEQGKQVTVLIEIKARFDEANNIEWGKKLERAGVHVIYGVLGLKTHSKASLIVRREGDDLRRYVHVATGNYNPATSAAYTDLGLLTADEEIGADVTELFNFLTVYSQRKEFQTLLVAPLNLRERMLQAIAVEADNARRGLPSRIIAKFNRLADSEIVEALYAASQAGVKIDLIVRGICTLRPGVPGLSENIKVRSIVGRLLEHSRVYYFENAGDPQVFIGSSDWMPRNLDRRVEVLTPVRSAPIREYLRNVYLESYLRDNVRSREMGPDGVYTRAIPSPADPLFDSQLFFQGRSNVLKFALHAA